MSPGSDLCIKYDIENFKRFPNVFIDGEMCVMTEKIHGTWSQVILFFSQIFVKKKKKKINFNFNFTL